MPLRLRLALLNAVVLAGAIVLLSGLAYAQIATNLDDQIDDSLENQAHNLSTLYQARESLSPRARERLIPQPSVFSPTTYLVQVLDGERTIIERSSSLGDRVLPIRQDALRRAGEGETVHEDLTLDGQHFRLITVAVETDDAFLGYIEVARSLEPLEQELALLGATLVRAGAAMCLISLGLAWFLAGASLRPIARITQAARDIALSGRLDRRLPPLRSRDEVARLAETFNRMMDRLENAFSAQRRFIADASHELRTPLTTIRGNIEIMRRTKSSQPTDIAEALDDVLVESERMSRLVDGLLALARADAGQALAQAPVQLDELVRSVCRELQPVSGEVEVAVDGIEPVELVGDADALKQLILILVENGVKYTSPSGTVTVNVKRDGKDARLSVRDTGPGISEQDLPHIFDRFYRSPSARGAGGTGLGLAIAQWIVQAHGGAIEVQSVLAQGSTFLVRLPGAHRGPLTGAAPSGDFVFVS